MRVFVTVPLVIASFGMVLFSQSSNAQNPKEVTNSIGVRLLLIPKGSFQMGSTPEEKGSDDDEKQHSVTITHDYYLGVFEVTQAQYKKVMGKNPSYFQGNNVATRIPAKKHPETGRTIEEEKIIPVNTDNHPVEFVSWEEAVEFCKRLSDLPEEKKAGRVYRLPTEAEWEYACRAGTKTAYSFGADRNVLKDFDWFGDNSGGKIINSDRIWEKSREEADIYIEKLLENGGKTHPVGTKKANPWGLYDMHGNVCEWCSDWYGNYPKQAITDPIGPKLGLLRVHRGGGWSGGAADCRSAYRFWDAPSYRGDYLGFRVALSSSGIPKSPEADK
jgi:formylglycine-generating enzyme required for sulfatase activity